MDSWTIANGSGGIKTEDPDAIAELYNIANELLAVEDSWMDNSRDFLKNTVVRQCQNVSIPYVSLSKGQAKWVSDVARRIGYDDVFGLAPQKTKNTLKKPTKPCQKTAQEAFSKARDKAKDEQPTPNPQMTIIIAQLGKIIKLLEGDMVPEAEPKPTPVDDSDDIPF